MCCVYTERLQTALTSRLSSGFSRKQARGGSELSEPNIHVTSLNPELNKRETIRACVEAGLVPDPQHHQLEELQPPGGRSGLRWTKSGLVGPPGLICTEDVDCGNTTQFGN